MSLWITRIVLLILVIVALIAIYRIQRIIYLDKRLSDYSVHGMDDTISVMDRVGISYRSFLSRFQNSDKLKKHADRYRKYVVLGDNDHPVFFIIRKLIIGFGFTFLVVISSFLNGKFVSFFGIIFSFIFGYYLYDIYLYFYVKYKKKRIKNDMLRAVILMNNSFKAGKSIMQAVYIASEELPKAIGMEFRRIYQDMSYGLSADLAFQRFSKRVRLEEATYVASSLSILNQTGGNIVSVFNTIEKTLFDRKKLENDLKTSAAASNLVVKFLMVIPVVFVILIYAINPHYFDSLFSSFLGYFLLFIMWFMFIIYIYLLNKILKVRV